MTFKKITLLFFLLGALATANVNWNGYKETFFKAEKSELKKDVFVFVVSENCRYCDKMKLAIKKDKKFQSYLIKNFHAVLINSSKDFMPMELDSGMTPSFFILDKETLGVKGGPYVGSMPLKVLKRKIIHTQ